MKFIRVMLGIILACIAIYLMAPILLWLLAFFVALFT